MSYRPVVESVSTKVPSPRKGREEDDEEKKKSQMSYRPVVESVSTKVTSPRKGREEDDEEKKEVPDAVPTSGGERLYKSDITPKRKRNDERYKLMDAF